MYTIFNQKVKQKWVVLWMSGIKIHVVKVIDSTQKSVQLPYISTINNNRPKMGYTLLVDNYDSFTWNIYADIATLGGNPLVRRNDKITIADVQVSLSVRWPSELCGETWTVERGRNRYQEKSAGSGLNDNEPC